MKCSSCGEETNVLDSRLTPDNFVRRRRVCTGCGRRTTTWESTRRPDTRDRSEYFAARYAAKTPEQKRRARLRRQARDEARTTGEPVETIYARWGVA